MTAKEYLSQAYRIDRIVKAKMVRVRELQDLVISAKATITDMPMCPTRSTHRMEDIIIKIIDMKEDIQTEIDKLLNIAHDISNAINGLHNPDYRILLELRYLCYKPWSEIAEDMRYSKDYIFELHRKALDGIRILNESKSPQ